MYNTGSWDCGNQDVRVPGNGSSLCLWDYVRTPIPLAEPHDIQLVGVGCRFLPARARGAELSEVIRQLPRLVDISLKHVQATGDFEIGDSELVLILAARPRIRSLCVEGRESLTDRALQAIGDSAGSTLRRLEIPGNELITDNGVSRLVNTCRGLTVLSLSACVQVHFLFSLP